MPVDVGFSVCGRAAKLASRGLVVSALHEEFVTSDHDLRTCVIDHGRTSGRGCTFQH